MIATDRGIGMTSQRTRNRLVERLREKGIRNEKVLDVIGKTPRHLFVDEALASRAYEDSSLPIGFGQTISQPYIVARMTAALIKGNQCLLPLTLISAAPPPMICASSSRPQGHR